jgi:hypothetical protein
MVMVVSASEVDKCHSVVQNMHFLHLHLAPYPVLVECHKSADCYNNVMHESASAPICIDSSKNRHER